MTAAENASFGPGEGQSLTDFTGTPETYVDLISDQWNWVYGTMFVTEYTDEWLNPYWEVKLVTGGWSHNEETLDVIAKGMFHLLFWESIHRGGLHIYHVPSKRWREVMTLGEM